MGGNVLDSAYLMGGNVLDSAYLVGGNVLNSVGPQLVHGYEPGLGANCYPPGSQAMGHLISGNGFKRDRV